MSRFTEATYEVTALRRRGRVVVRLTSPMVYEIGYLGSGWLLTARPGFETDLTSVPILPKWAPLWLVRFRDYVAERLARSSIPHDLCRADPRCPKLTGDGIFWEAMGADDVPAWLRVSAFLLALLNFGRD